MKTSFLDYYKLILQKVSFDPALFDKEYRKALQRLRPDEAEQLRKWVRQKPVYQSPQARDLTTSIKL